MRIHDPKVEEKQISFDLQIPSMDECSKNPELQNQFKDKRWNKFSLNEEFFLDIDAVVILTEWDEYSNINWSNYTNLMRFPGWVFDSRSILDSEKVKNAELNFWRVGDGS